MVKQIICSIHRFHLEFFFYNVQDFKVSYWFVLLFSGNGDILSYEDAVLRREQTGVSGLMIARYNA